MKAIGLSSDLLHEKMQETRRHNREMEKLEKQKQEASKWTSLDEELKYKANLHQQLTAFRAQGLSDAQIVAVHSGFKDIIEALNVSDDSKSEDDSDDSSDNSPKN